MEHALSQVGLGSIEGVFLRNIRPSVGLSDHFPGSEILNYRSDRDWSLRYVILGQGWANCRTVAPKCDRDIKLCDRRF